MALPVDWVNTMLNFYRQGYSDAEVCRELGVSKKQFRTYIERSTSFAELVEFGHDLAEAWALEQNRLAVNGDNYNAVNMKALEKRLENMHGWSQKVETKDTSKHVEEDVAKLKQELYALLPDMARLAGRTDVVLQLEADRGLPVSDDGE